MKIKKGFTPTPNLIGKVRPVNLVWGFTIVEVLVVIGIIAVLTVIIFPSLNNIRKKNRDAEKIADIASLQLGLSMYYNQHSGEYPPDLQTLVDSKYVTTDTQYGPDGKEYTYTALERYPNSKCTYYHLGTLLELSSGQVDSADTFDSTGLTKTPGSYYYCGVNTTGLTHGGNNYNVHP